MSPVRLAALAQGRLREWRPLPHLAECNVTLPLDMTKADAPNVPFIMPGTLLFRRLAWQ